MQKLSLIIFFNHFQNYKIHSFVIHGRTKSFADYETPSIFTVQPFFEGAVNGERGDREMRRPLVGEVVHFRGFGIPNIVTVVFGKVFGDSSYRMLSMGHFVNIP